MNSHNFLCKIRYKWFYIEQKTYLLIAERPNFIKFPHFIVDEKIHWCMRMKAQFQHDLFELNHAKLRFLFEK